MAALVEWLAQPTLSSSTYCMFGKTICRSGQDEKLKSPSQLPSLEHALRCSSTSAGVEMKEFETAI